MVLAGAALLADADVADYVPDGVLVLAVADPDTGCTELGWAETATSTGGAAPRLHRSRDKAWLYPICVNPRP